MAPTLLVLVATLAPGAALVGTLAPPGVIEAVVGRIVNDEAAALAEARGVRPGRPLAIRVLDRPHLEAERNARPFPRWPRADAGQAAAALWRRLGMGAGDPDRSDATSGQNVTGLYDPVAKQLVIASWVALEAGRFARWHDIAQAVLDRRFGLDRFLASSPQAFAADVDSDSLLARQALVEGDATVQALERLAPEGPPPTPVLAALAESVHRTMAEELARASRDPIEVAERLFATLDGTTFVAAIRARFPWDAVNEIWAHPPASSEQILHPDKYHRHEPPRDLAARLPRELPGGWHAVYRDTLGELGARVFLQRAVGDYRAERAAAGWGGDRVGLYRSAEAAMDPTTGGDGDFAVWMTIWDDVTDADDFAEQASYALAAMAGRAGTLTSEMAERSPRARRRTPRRWRQTDAAGRTFALEQRGPVVGMMIGAPPDLERTLSTLIATPSARANKRPIP